jgi:uncharacterized membrane protein
LIAELRTQRRFPQPVLDAIRQAIVRGEQRHTGQVCFAIEAALPFGELWAGRAPRERAQQAFAHLRVWDTAANSGVLINVLLADHAIEVVADRGIAARVQQDEWQALCEHLRERFAAGDYERGAIDAVAAASAILAREFPSDGSPRDNELSDAPVIL